MALQLSKAMAIGAVAAVALGGAGVLAVSVSGATAAPEGISNPVHRMLFASIDRNADGRVDRREAETSDFSMSVKGGQQGAQKIAVEHMNKADRFMYAFDTNGDDVVMASEFASVMDGSRKGKVRECGDRACAP